MTVLTIFAANSSAADARDTLNQMLSDIAALKDTGGTTPPAGGPFYQQTVNDTGYQNLAGDGTITFQHPATFPFYFDVLSDADGTPGFRIRCLSGDATKTLWSGYKINPDTGAEEQQGGFNGAFGPPMGANNSLKVQTVGQFVDLFVNSDTRWRREGLDYLNPQLTGRAARVVAANGVTTTVTMTKA